MPFALTRTNTMTDPWEMSNYIHLKKWLMKHGATKTELFRCSGIEGIRALLPNYGFPRPDAHAAEEAAAVRESAVERSPSPVFIDRARSDNVEDFVAQLEAKAQHVKDLEHDNELLTIKEKEAAVTVAAPLTLPPCSSPPPPRQPDHEPLPHPRRPPSENRNK